MKNEFDEIIKMLWIYSYYNPTYGFTDMESALHAVFCMEGKKQGTFYVESDGVIYLQENV